MIRFARKAAAVLLLATVIISFRGGIAAGEDAAGFESAGEAAFNMKVGWNLGNSLDATGDWIAADTAGTIEDYETAWGNPVTPQSLFPKLKSMGVSTVRIPVTWRGHFDEDGNIDPAWMSRVKELADWGLDAGLYVIINVHHDTGAEGWMRASDAGYASGGPVFVRLWEQIGATFRDYPQELLFEGFNELLDEGGEWNYPGEAAVNAVNRFNQDFVDTVRSTGGNNTRRNLICSTYAAAVTGSCLTGWELPEDSAEGHLLAEVHCYVPYEFITDEGITWTTPVSEYGPRVQAAVDDFFTRLKNTFAAQDIPVVIGEFATDDKDNTDSRILWYSYVASQAHAINAPCIIWDNGHGFSMGIIDRTGSDDEFPQLIEACVQAYKTE